MRIWIQILVASALLCPGTPSMAGILIRNIRLIEGGLVSEPTDLLIEGTAISKRGSLIPAAGHSVYDASGLFALPGLIDSHTHLTSVPGALYRKDAPQEVERQQKIQLASYLAAGVTTILDPAIPLPTLQKLKAYQEETGLGPRILALGPVLMPPGGYLGTENFRKGDYAALPKPVTSEKEIRDGIIKSKELKTLGVKLAMENGLGPIPNYTVFSAEQRTRIAEIAKDNEVKIFVHSMSEAEHRLALELKPYALVHAGFNEGSPSADFLQKLADSGTYVITTISIYDAMDLMWDAERIERDGFSFMVPRQQRETLKNPAALAYVKEEALRESLPSWLSYRLLLPLVDFFFSQKKVQEFSKSAQRAMLKMQQKGVKLVVGSDSGNWPIFTSFFHGYGTIRELDMLLDAGLPPAEVLAMASTRPAAMLGLAHEIGTLDPGKKADLILLAENPLQSKRALRSIKLVMKDGRMRTPQEWMQLAQQKNQN